MSGQKGHTQGILWSVSWDEFSLPDWTDIPCAPGAFNPTVRRLVRRRPVPALAGIAPRVARLGRLAGFAGRRGSIARTAAHGGEVGEEAAGADARIVRHALDDADQHLTLAVELGDRTARVAHAGARADRAASPGIHQRA